MSNTVSIVSVPVEKPQPHDPYYGSQFLELFQVFSNQSYLDTFGVKPPPFDPTRRPKLWFDTAVVVGAVDLTENIEYLVLHRHPTGLKAGEWEFENIALSRLEASEVNIPPDTTTGMGPLPPYWDTPVRQLKTNEELLSTPFGLKIKRTDLAQQADEAAGKFTSKDRKVLNAIAAAHNIDRSTL